jgi:hypothetical protein
MMRSFSLRTRFATCSTRASAAPVADFNCEAAPLAARRLRDCVPLARPPVERPLLERPLVERALVERALLERPPLARPPLEREPLERELLLLLRELDERLVPDDPPEERRDPEPPDDELDLEPPLLACGTSPPLPGQQSDVDTISHRAGVGRFRETPGASFRIAAGAPRGARRSTRRVGDGTTHRPPRVQYEIQPV